MSTCEGTSHSSVALIRSAYALNNRLTPFISMQNQHNAMYREEEREMMPMLKHYGVGVIPWGPVAAGCKSFPFTFGFLHLAIAHPCSVLCRPYKDMGATARGASRVKDGRGDAVSFDFPSSSILLAHLDHLRAMTNSSLTKSRKLQRSATSLWQKLPLRGLVNHLGSLRPLLGLEVMNDSTS